MKISVGPLGLLGLIFITLRLCGVIDWAWVWVLCPIWIPFALVAGIALVFGLFFAVCFAVAVVVEMVKGGKRA